MEFRIREKREEAGLTQIQLAKESGVSRSIISGLESGAITVTTTETLSKIAKALKVSIGEIFFEQKV